MKVAPQDNQIESQKIMRIPIILSLSDLQSRILRHICTTNNASYKTLMEEIKRDRITILQSLESLIQYRYIEKQKVNPKHEKSKLIFVPTHKGISHLWLSLDVKIEDITKTNRDDYIDKYIEFIKDVFEPSQHKQMLQPLFSILERGDLDYEEGDDKKKNLIKEYFHKGLLELVQLENYKVQNLFNDKSIEWLKNLYTSKELKEFKKLFVRARDNLTLTIERFPG